MVRKSIRVQGLRIHFEWHPDPAGTGGQVEGLPGAMGFHADSLDEAKGTVRSLYDKRATV